MRCEKHPKYKAKKKPKADCDACWSMYIQAQSRKHRAPIMPTQKHKDVTKYNRRKSDRLWKKDYNL